MALKTFRPLTPTNRFKALPSFEEITKSKPEKSLVETKHKTGGRNAHGRITTRHIGGGHKQKYRIIDFKRRKRGVEAEVKAIEYDPNRTCRIALLKYTDGEKAYILAPAGLSVGDKVNAGDSVEAKVGNALPLSAIPLGTSIHNVELVPVAAVRSPQRGQQVILNNREAGYALVRCLRRIRKIHENCYATIGQVGNIDT